MATFDGVIIGAGHNSLILGAYLAKAGLHVAVVERNPEIGGGTTTEEVTLPGFRHNLHSNFHKGMTEFPVYRDLELSRYGLHYIVPHVQHACVFRDGRCAVIHRDPERTAASFARFSRHDAESYRELHETYAVKMKEIIRAFLFSPPSPPDEVRARLDGAQGEELLSHAPLSIYEAVDRHFEDEHIRVLFKLMLHGSTAENVPGTGMFFPFTLANVTSGALPVGGSVNLPLALARVIEAHGGAIIRGQHVERIDVKGGAARGVVLSDGTRLAAERFVASGVDAPQTIRLAGEEHFPSEVVSKLRNWDWGVASLLTIHLALDSPPEYAAADFDPDVNRAMNVWMGADHSEEIAATFTEIARGAFPSRLMANAACNTLFDPSYAPPGKHVAFWWPFAPYELAEGGSAAWDERKEEFRVRVLEAWRAYAPNLTTQNVQKSFLFTPLDISRHVINMVRGSVRMGAYYPHQLGMHRPHPALAHYRTPVGGLYLCGSTSAGGAGVSGGAGYNAANIIAEDQGIKRWWQPVAPPTWKE